MKYALIVIGVVLIIAAVLMATFGGGTDDNRVPGPGIPEYTVQDHVSRQPQQLFSNVPWTQYRVVADGISCQIYVREYPEPIVLGKAMEGFVPSKDSRKSGFGIMALSFYLGRTAGLAERAQLFEDPEKVMAHFELLAEMQGGMDKVVENLHKYSEKALATEQLLGEAIIGEYYIYVFKRVELPPTLHVYKRARDGSYCIPNEWSEDESISLWIRDHKLIGLFPKYKNAWEEFEKKWREQQTKEGKERRNHDQ